MIDQEEIDRQQSLLATNRRTLAHYLEQQAMLGKAHAPPGVIHGIYEASANIRQIKTTLRSWGVTVQDYPDDEQHVPTPRPSSTSDSLNPPRPLRIFLCHSSGDKPQVYQLYQRLRADGFEPWLDKEDLLPGQDWRKEIPKAVRAADVVIVCLSRRAITKNGYIQQEIEFALDAAESQPAGAISLIPVKLKECSVPDRLSRWQWVNLFERDGYERLLRALHMRAYTVGLMAMPAMVRQRDIQAATTSTSSPPASVQPILDPRASTLFASSPQTTLPPQLHPSTSVLTALQNRLTLPLSSYGKTITLTVIGSIALVVVILVALNQLNKYPRTASTSSATDAAVGQLAAAPTTSMIASSVPSEAPPTLRPSMQLTIAATPTRTEQPMATPMIASATAVAPVPTDSPMPSTPVPTPKPTLRATANTQATIRAEAQLKATAQAEARAAALTAQPTATPQPTITPEPTATPQPTPLRADVPNEIRSFHVVEQTKNSFVADIEYSYDGSHGDQASITMRCPAGIVRPGSTCTITVYPDLNDFMTIGTGAARRGMDYNVAPGDSFETDVIEVCMEYEIDRGSYQTFLCRTFKYKKTWSN
jgi:hypothetical protein